MSLKSEINQTEILKNKTKKAKENINTKLVALGGQNANNLADVPSKINGLASQYKKVAIITPPAEEYTLLQKGIVKIPLNINFNPEKIYIEIFKPKGNAKYDDYCGGYAKKKEQILRAKYDHSQEVLIDLKDLNKSYIELNIDFYGREQYVYVIIKKIIAIG